MGSTAYDVASSGAMRGYLLPRQLQAETRMGVIGEGADRTPIITTTTTPLNNNNNNGSGSAGRMRGAGARGTTTSAAAADRNRRDAASRIEARERAPPQPPRIHHNEGRVESCGVRIRVGVIDRGGEGERRGGIGVVCGVFDCGWQRRGGSRGI